MKILAIGRIAANTDRDQLKTVLRQDEEKVWELYAMDIIREMYLPIDESGEVLILECEQVNKANHVLKGFPSVKQGVIEFELLPLKNFALPQEIRQVQVAPSVKKSPEQLLAESLRPAELSDYVIWLEGYIEKGGCPTHVYDYPFSQTRGAGGFSVATQDFSIGPRYGASSVHVIVPKGIQATCIERGNSILYFMDGFTCSEHAWVPVYQDFQGKLSEKAATVIAEFMQVEQERERKREETERAKALREREWLDTLRLAHVADYIAWAKGYLERGGRPTAVYEDQNFPNGTFYLAVNETHVPERHADAVHLIVPEGIKATVEKPGWNRIYYMDGFTCIGNEIPIYADMLGQMGENAERIIQDLLQRQQARQKAEQAKTQRQQRWLRFLRPAHRSDYIGWLKGYIAHGGKPTRVHDYPLNEREIRNFYVATKNLTVTAIPHESGRNIIIPKGVNVSVKDLGNYNLYYLDGFIHIGQDVPIYQDMEEEVGFME